VSPVQLAAVLAAVILVASTVSVELGVTVALLELTLGVAAGNLFHLQTQDWLDFIAQFGSIVLTFLAGMEVDPAYMRRRLGPSLGLGIVSFVGPFAVTSLVAYVLLDWSTRASLIAGTALSTTSLAVVYAVLVERGLTHTAAGKLLMSATFVTDLCTALALSAIFIKPNVWFPAFLVVSLALILVLPRLAPWFFGRYGDRVIRRARAPDRSPGRLRRERGVRLGGVGHRVELAVDGEALERRGLDLAHALARDSQLPADRLERLRVAVAVQAVAKLHDLALTFR